MTSSAQPAATAAFLAEAKSRAGRIRDVTSGQAEMPRGSRLDAFLQAAAVLHVFDPLELRSVRREQASGDEIAGVVAASVPAVGFRDRGLRTLSTRARREALASLGSRRAMRDALAANQPPKPITTAQRVLGTWLEGEPYELGRMTFEELECLRQLYDWDLERFGELPDRRALDYARTWRSAVRLFEHLVDDTFVGRRGELELLRRHVSPAGERGVMIISGVGGAGKTALVGRFLMERFEQLGRAAFPFAYLPFDAETLDVREPYTVLLAAAHQLTIGEEAAGGELERAAATFQEEVAIYRDRRGALHRRASEIPLRGQRLADLGTAERYLFDAFAQLVEAARLEVGGGVPALLIFDTFEEVSYRTREDLYGFWSMLNYLRDSVPSLRVIIAGRAATARPELSEPAETLELNELSEEDGAALLVRLGVHDAETARVIRRQVGGNPLSLRLAAHVAQAEGTDRGGLTGDAEREDILSIETIGTELVQGSLYRRLLNHIHDADVRALAHPGMALRRVTPGVIRAVLAPACGLVVDTIERATALFDALHHEQALVSLDADGSLRYREDVRRPVLELLGRDAPAQVRRIHELAVAYYEHEGGTAERAEELYHRMLLRQDDWQLDPRWLPEVEPYLVSAIDELPVAQRRWLAGRMSVELAPEVYAQADLSEWERLIGHKAIELVRYGRPQDVLALLHERSERTLDSPLFTIEARCWLDLGDQATAAQLLDRALAGYPLLGNAGRLAELLWLRAQAAGSDDVTRTEFLLRLRGLVTTFRTSVPLVQVLTEELGWRNPGDLADPPGSDIGSLRHDLAEALSRLSPAERSQEASLVRLAMVRLGPHYPDLVADLGRAVTDDLAHLLRRGMITNAYVPAPSTPALSNLIDTTLSALEAAIRDETTTVDLVALTSSLLDVLRVENASLAGSTLAGIEDYLEPWELTTIREVMS